MAKQKKEDPPKAGAPAWMATFSDLMNLLLTFFVLLFSMSSVDSEEFENVAASMHTAFSILPAGGSGIGDGDLVSAGINQLEYLDEYYTESANTATTEEGEESGGETDIEEAYEAAALAESEEMAEEASSLAAQYGIDDEIDVEFNSQYVLLNMNGAILFDNAQAELKSDAYPLVDKVGKILEHYQKNMIEVEGHTDNVPMHSAKYEDNNVLSMFRALYVADYLREITNIDDSHFKSSGRGDYAPIADNSTPEGRAKNRRVEIKIYNSYYSDLE